MSMAHSLPDSRRKSPQTDPITFTPAQPVHAAQLPAIERAAAQVFRRLPALTWIADAPPMSEDEHLQLIAQGHVWVAQRQLVHAQPVGFLAAQVLGHALHIRELSVHPDWQGRGVGTGLLAQARQQAHSLGLPCLTLTTFRDVPWNAPWYSRLGFEPAPDEPRLAELLRTEAEHGLATHPRVAMRLRLA